jgi:ATP-binding cassette subfamily F protein uup
VAILLTARALSHAFSQRPLFDAISFTLSDGDRIGLIGPNGAGKSTLLRILAGQTTADLGEIILRGGTRIGYLAQTPSFPADASVRATVQGALRAAGDARALDWDEDARVDAMLSKLQLTGPEVQPDDQVRTLSGGWQKRVALARELVIEPDLLLLDEPTNHLDVESILWLERLLLAAQFATITVTHDRMFLQRVSRRILELDRRNAGGLLSVDGDYAKYVEQKADAMAAQEQREQTLRNTLRRETEWLRRGPAARTTKQEARIERAADLADEVAALGQRNRTRKAEIELEARGRKTRKLIEAIDVSKSYADRPVFEHLDLLIGPGTRLALLGPNGCGKSTLLRVLIGAEPSSSGSVVRAHELVVQTFEQNRESLDPDKTVADSVAEGDAVDYRGSRLHRYGYLERFLFRPEQMHMRVGNLSGGEQSRLLIARLMLRPADVFVLDEPTNDLDFETLNVLQEALQEFPGAVLLVSHDRYFVDQVATQILAFHTAASERGRSSLFADLHQWQAWHATQWQNAREREPASANKPAAGNKKKKLSYKDQRDWESIEARILAAENQLEVLGRDAGRPDIVSNAAQAFELHAAMELKRSEIEQLYARWAELEALIVKT